MTWSNVHSLTVTGLFGLRSMVTLFAPALTYPHKGWQKCPFLVQCTLTVHNATICSCSNVPSQGNGRNVRSWPSVHSRIM